MNHHRHNNEPWDQGLYETGRTRPPKRYGGLIAILLVLVIFLSGLVSVLGILNVRLFAQLTDLSQKQQDDEISFISENEETQPIPEDPTEGTPPSIPTEHSPSIELIPAPASLEDPAPVEDFLSLQEIYSSCIDSVVSISCSGPSGSSTGTGVIISADGYIVTNCHVVEHAQSIQVLLTDERSFEASLVGSDAVSDLAVLHISAQDLSAARFGDSNALLVGDSVVAIGDPLGIELRGTMTNGIISAINRDVTTGGRTMTLIQTNAALNSGNSGGPLINSYGQIIGITSMKISTFTDEAGVEGIGFAIPSATVKEIVEQLISQGYVSGRPTLGVSGEGVSNFYQFYYNMPPGLYITSVEEDSSAAEIGIEPGDILLSLDGTRISGPEGLTTALYSYEAGDTVTVVIYRAGRQYTVTLTLTESRG